MGDQAMAYAPQADEAEEVIGALDHVQRRVLHSGCILVTGGWLVLAYTTIGNRAANAEHALIGLALILGVFLIVLAPVADQFPAAAQVGNLVADFVLLYFFPPAGN